MIFNTNHMGLFFTNRQNAGFRYNKSGIERTLNFRSSNGIVGVDLNNTADGNLDFSGNLLPGPYTNQNDYSYEVMDKYNRGYFVTKTMIENHITEIGNNTPGYEIPFGIKHWPAHGNVSIGQAENLAPFEDRNLNGVYDPENGDYPSIVGDECLLNIVHKSSGSNDGGVFEALTYFYVFDCDTSDLLNHTVFVQQDFISKGIDLNSAYLINKNDFDLGNASDDYMGTEVTLGLTYVYNGDNFDDDYGGVGFHDTLPAFGSLILSGVKSISDGIDNSEGVLVNESINGIGFGDGVIDNEIYSLTSSLLYSNSSSGLANNNLELYNISQGLGGLGTPQTNGAGVIIKHSFFGHSDPLFYSSNGVNHGNNYSEIIAGTPPGDKRSYSSSGPGTFHNSDTLSVLYAYIVGIDTININYSAGVKKLFLLAGELKTACQNNQLGCGNSFDPYVSQNEASLNEVGIDYLTIFPNPTNESINIQGLVGQSTIKIMDANGRILEIEKFSESNVSLTVSSYDSAVYFLYIEDERSSKVYRIIKKQHDKI